MATFNDEGYEVVSGNYTVWTAASEQAALSGGNEVDEDAAERAATANVTHPAYVNYVAALTNYEERSDTEPLALRRARTVGATFDETDQYRAVDPDTPVTAAPLTSQRVQQDDSDKVGGFVSASSEDVGTKTTKGTGGKSKS